MLLPRIQRVDFDLVTEYFQDRHIWVLLPSLPLQFWNEGALMAMGSALEQFIALDTSFKDGKNLSGIRYS